MYNKHDKIGFDKIPMNNKIKKYQMLEKLTKKKTILIKCMNDLERGIVHRLQDHLILKPVFYSALFNLF